MYAYILLHCWYCSVTVKARNMIYIAHKVFLVATVDVPGGQITPLLCLPVLLYRCAEPAVCDSTAFTSVCTAPVQSWLVTMAHAYRYVAMVTVLPHGTGLYPRHRL